MLISTLTESLVEHLNTNKSQWLPDDIEHSTKAKACLDYVTEIKHIGLKVLVVPEINQYNIGGTNARERIKVLDTQKFVSVLINYTLKELPVGDSIAPWDEVKYIVDIRENIETFLITTDYQSLGVKLVDLEPQPISEQQLDKRNFNAVTSFVYEDITCGQRHEYNSSSAALSEGIGLLRTRASTQSQPLSGRRPGRA